MIGARQYEHSEGVFLFFGFDDPFDLMKTWT
jgi:hypothetical protein